MKSIESIFEQLSSSVFWAILVYVLLDFSRECLLKRVWVSLEVARLFSRFPDQFEALSSDIKFA